METIKDFCNKNFQKRAELRLAQMKALGAPRQVIAKIEQDIESGDFASKVGKINDFGHLEIVSFASKDYRRGTGVVFTTEAGKVFLIPGPYGFFLTE